jgi:UDP-2,4-diacetamido-2,4,6-trideoxy-beta-L-altropyranose hydrolase
LKKSRVIFRADGNPKIGYGHFVRTLGIAGLINVDFHCIYATILPTEYQITEINKVCNEVIFLPDDNSNFDLFFKYLEPNDIVVVDDYNFEENYQNRIREIGCKLIYIDDHNDKNYVCDVLINNIPGFSSESFKKEKYTKLCLGTDYALLRKEFFNPNLRSIVKNENSIFISFGGSDVFNISEKIIEFLNRISNKFIINLLIGDGYKYFDNLAKFPNLIIHKNINANDVAQLIAVSGLCIIPASSLLNEAASIGSNLLIGYFADNQIQPYNYFVNNNLALGIGDYRNLDFLVFEKKIEQLSSTNYLIENQKKIYHYQQETNLKKIFYDISSI